jgi:hypothetical protein
MASPEIIQLKILIAVGKPEHELSVFQFLRTEFGRILGFVVPRCRFGGEVQLRVPGKPLISRFRRGQGGSTKMPMAQE